MTEIADLVPVLEGLTGAEATISGGGVLLVVLIALLLPDRFKFLYSRGEFNRMRKDRDHWRERYDQKRG